MDRKSQRLLNVLIFFSLVLTLGITVITNPGNISGLIPLSILLVLSFSLRRKPLLGPKIGKMLANCSFLTDILILYFISLLDMSRVSQIYFYVLIIDAVLFYSIRLSLVTAFTAYFMYVFIRFIRYIRWNTFDFAYFSPALYEDGLYFILVFLTVYIAKRQIIQSQVLSETMKELETKTAQLGETNSKLQDTLVKLEGMTVLKERNRIVREIHDTVGHTLATVLIEIEAGRRLIGSNPQNAEEKFELAQEQVRKGLNDIRQSVRTLKEGNDILSLIPAIKSLIIDTQMHADVMIEFSCDQALTISELQGKVLFSAFQEGLVNGIKHGRCNSFAFTLSKKGNDIYFQLKDDGCGSDKVNPGFGLTAMKERVEGLGGSLKVDTGPGKGFSVDICMPDGEDESDENCQSAFS